MTKQEYLASINQFESHYGYDSSYMREMLESSLDLYQKFDTVKPLTGHQELVDKDALWVAKLAVMISEDCGECLELNVKMALESGISKELVASVVNHPDILPATYKDIYDFAIGVSTNTLHDGDLIERIQSRFSKGQLIEIGVAVSINKIFPGIKRALGYVKSCSLYPVNVEGV